MVHSPTETLPGVAGTQSVPALLHRNAKEFGDAPAYREKEFGIWQSWSWAKTEEEVEATMDVLPESAALVGFYSYGEISPFTPLGKCELHNQTMTITTLSEL